MLIVALSHSLMGYVEAVLNLSSLAEVTEHLRWWTAHVADKRIHGTTKR